MAWAPWHGHMAEGCLGQPLQLVGEEGSGEHGQCSRQERLFGCQGPWEHPGSVRSPCLPWDTVYTQSPCKDK